ncbi:MAG: methyltransferase domain-containing protein [Patescibacteria group bacterium]|nr:methyltransferase domain-containing protein [Patescibacteria group bacterium]
MNGITQKNRKTYDALAKEYDEKAAVRKTYNAGIFDRFSQFITTGKEILDIGCAVGLDLENFTEKGFIPTGIELSGEMVKRARKRNPGAKIYEGDFIKLEIQGQFDAVWAQSFIHLFPKKEVPDVLGKIRNCLKDEGVAYFTTTKSEKSSEGWVEKADYTGNHKRFRKHWIKNELQETFEQAGFSILEYYEINDPFNKTFMIFTLKK